MIEIGRVLDQRGLSQTTLCHSEINKRPLGRRSSSIGSQNPFSRERGPHPLLRHVLCQIRGCDGHSGLLYPSDAGDVECHPCPRCHVQPGSPCRSRGGAVAGAYHAGRFTKVPVSRSCYGCRPRPMLAGRLPGIYDPTRPGKLLFAFFAAMAETERENIRESTLEGLDTAARKGAPTP